MAAMVLKSNSFSLDPGGLAESQLRLANQYAEVSRDTSLASAARTLALDFHDKTIGGGGGGGGRGGGGRTISTASFDCVGGPGGCPQNYLEVPELFQRPSDLARGVERRAMIIKGCEPPLVLGSRLAPVPIEPPPSREIRLVRSAGQALVGRSDSRAEPIWRASLSPRPAWLTDG